MEKMDDKTKEVVCKIFDVEASLLEEQSFIDILKDYCEYNTDSAQEIENITLLTEIIDEKHKISKNQLEEFISHLREVL